MKIAAVVPAAGLGKRFRSKIPKLFVSLHGKPLLVHTLQRLIRCFNFEEMVVLVGQADLKNVQRLLKRHGLGEVRLVVGGVTRADSVRRGVENVSKNCDWILVHDGARPFVDKKLVLNTILAAKITGAALCAEPVTSTVKRVDLKRGVVLSTEDRRLLYLAQTPQVFRQDLLVARYKILRKKALAATDEAALFDGSGISVRVVAGHAKNIKITTVDDLELFNPLQGSA